MKPVPIPRHVDEPVQILLWSADEVLPLLILLGIGIAVGRVFSLLVIGLLVTKIWVRYKNSKPEGYIFHKLFWYGVVSGRGRCKNGFVREYLP